MRIEDQTGLYSGAALLTAKDIFKSAGIRDSACKNTAMSTAVLLLSIPIAYAHKGAVAAITQFLVTHNGRILHADDHVDGHRAIFLSRLEWDLACFDIPVSDFEKYFNPLAEQYRFYTRK